jgi:hypothetical protein
MTVGARTLGDASLNIGKPRALPAAMRGNVRELLALHSDTTGHASALLTRTMAEADDTATPLFLHCDPESGDVARLARLYQRFGFAPIQAEPLLMLRMPNEARA